MTERMPFLDLETTGLIETLDDPNPGRILECAILAVDLPSFREVARINVVFAFKEEAPNMPVLHPRVRAMHEASGLLAECRATTKTVYDGMVELSKFLIEQGCQGMPLAGANPDFDRAFLRKWAPDVEELFHYRNFDVNAFWQLDTILRGGDPTGKKHEAKHRALADCLDAVQNVHDHFEFVTELVAGFTKAEHDL
jgi:oligoribonuclease